MQKKKQPVRELTDDQKKMIILIEKIESLDARQQAYKTFLDTSTLVIMSACKMLGVEPIALGRMIFEEKEAQAYEEIVTKTMKALYDKQQKEIKKLSTGKPKKVVKKNSK